MKLFELIREENKTIFERYKELYPEDLLLLYGRDDDDFIDYLNLLFISLYGYKTVLRFICEHTYKDSKIDFIVWLLHHECFLKCRSLKELYDIKPDYKDSRKQTIKETVTMTGTTTRNNTLENIEKTFAYDSEEAVNDNANTNTDTGNTEQATETIKETVYSYQDKKEADLLNEEIERRKKGDFVLLTMKLYSNILFLDIYE